MAACGRRAWLSVLLWLLLGFVLASRLVLPCASEVKRAGPRRRTSREGCQHGQAAAATAASSQAGWAQAMRMGRSCDHRARPWVAVRETGTFCSWES
ncbi:Chondroitin sulfate synthase 1 [Sciurus carolinensis]|uniref:Chondroitin sulfate synthase 1 n=1 Tax=Sciurus carolinensis TaxID=30640 RepID=A0AA41SV50_SCICA|nr:Chondroitin sulfate synthase 1 [Sciurus carolinensis]